MPTGRHAANKRPDRTPWADQGGAKRREREAATQTSPKVSLGMPTHPAAPGDPGAIARFHHHWPWQGARACVFGHAGGASEARELDPPRADPVPDGGGAGSTGASGSDDGSHSEPNGDGLHAMTDFTLQGHTLDKLRIARYVLKYVLKNRRSKNRQIPVSPLQPRFSS